MKTAQSELENIMKYIEKNWETIFESERNAPKAATLRCKHGKVSITDGPFAETKEQLGVSW